LKKNDKALFISKIPPDIQSSLCLFSKYLDKFESGSCSIKSELCEEIAISFIEKILSINIFNEGQYLETFKCEDNWKLFKDIIDSVSIYRECVSINDIANMHNIQQRSLYNLFKKYIGISPSQYLLAYKLCAAQSSLVRERCLDDPVTRAAVNSEFYHLGRFSQYYKNHFGHLPSETVNRVHELHSQSRHSR
jgi:AraC-like DNA-binding protein